MVSLTAMTVVANLYNNAKVLRIEDVFCLEIHSIIVQGLAESLCSVKYNRCG